MNTSAPISVIIPTKGHPVLLDDAIAAVHREMASGAIRRLLGSRPIDFGRFACFRPRKET